MLSGHVVVGLAIILVSYICINSVIASELPNIIYTSLYMERVQKNCFLLIKVIAGMILIDCQCEILT